MLGSGGSPVRTDVFGSLLLVRAFIWKDLFSITCELWIGRLAAEVPVFSRDELGEIVQRKVKVLSSLQFCLFNFLVSA